MKFDPLKSSKKLAEDYQRYILTTFKTDDEKINKLLVENVTIDVVSNGPYLSLADNHERTCYMSELIPDPLSEGFYNLPKSALDPAKFRLYKHQADAINTVVTKDHNMVLSTGTGSGKTKSFLMPIINHLLREQSDNKLCPGVRAMLIYPMNALANDQMDILRSMLRGTKITFGSFIGETPNSITRELETKYFDTYGFKPENELISRDQIKATPPNILITNYAMLEHLLIKPENKQLFGRPGDNHWKYIVLDEAHMYSGARGSEVSILIRRLKEVLKRDEIRFIITSATLGEKDDNEKVVEFANELCGCAGSVCPFEIDDVVRANYHKTDDSNGTEIINDSFYLGLTQVIDECDDENFFEEDITSYLDSKYPGTKGNFRERIYDIASRDSRVYKLRSILKDDALNVYDVADLVGMDYDMLVSFIHVISLAEKDMYKLFDSKYHMFMRSIDGVYTTLTYDPYLSIHLMTEYNNPVTKNKEKMFQICTCYNCNHIHLIGKVMKGKFSQVSTSEDVIRDSVYMLMDEDKFVEDDYTEKELQESVFKICTVCGSISEYGFDLVCDHGNEYMRLLFRVKEGTDKIYKCENCGQKSGRRGLLRQFYLGHDSSTAVIASSLYGEMNDNSDRRFLSFSDNRQNAAYFAPYLKDTHENMVLHGAMWKTIEGCKEELEGPGIAIGDFKNKLEGLINKKSIYSSRLEMEFDRYGNKIEKKASASQDAWIILMIDCAKFNGNKSFEYMGQVYYAMDHRVKDFGFCDLPEDQARDLVNQIVKIVRDNLHVLIPSEINNEGTLDRYYSIIRPSTIPLDKNNRKGNEGVFLTKRVRKYLSLVVGEKNIVNVCKAIFRNCCESEDGRYSVKLEDLRIKRKNHVYRCTECNKVSPFNVKDICVWCCKPTLRAEDTSVMKDDNTYSHNYSCAPLRSLRIKEHTAQLDHDRARLYQRMFKEKDLDALSCSTTFEVGVDIGDLNVVFMRNVPPTPANYIQRAGRAGRSPDSSAYALTFCKNSSHDTNYFKNPADMIRGKVPVPNIKPDNPRIVIRHIFASALSFYWRDQVGHYQEGIQEFMDSYDDFEAFLSSHPPDIKRYLLGTVPNDIVDYKPDPGDEDGVIIDIENFGWVDELFSEKKGRLKQCHDEYLFEIQSLEKYQDKYNRDLESTRKRIEGEKTLEYLSRHNIIPKYGFPVDLVGLDNKNPFSKTALKLQRDLSRAISEYAPGSEVVADGMVLKSNYIRKIPSKNWPKYYYKTCASCQTTKVVENLGQSTDDLKELFAECPACKKPFSGVKIPQFVIPRYGFLYDDAKLKDLTTNKPTHTYNGEVFYRGKVSTNLKSKTIAGHRIHCAYGINDELVVINKSPFNICPLCGYGSLTEFDEKGHQNPYSRMCKGKAASVNLGHIFHTDVFILTLDECPIEDHNTALSILSALITAFCRAFSIDENEISGCLANSDRGFMFVLYDNTPGGAGYVKHILSDSEDNIYLLIMKAIEVAKNCDCGDRDNIECACYSCLLNYRNQKNHEKIKRSLVINALKAFEE